MHRAAGRRRIGPGVRSLGDLQFGTPPSPCWVILARPGRASLRASLLRLGFLYKAPRSVLSAASFPLVLLLSVEQSFRDTLLLAPRRCKQPTPWSTRRA